MSGSFRLILNCACQRVRIYNEVRRHRNLIEEIFSKVLLRFFVIGIGIRICVGICINIGICIRIGICICVSICIRIGVGVGIRVSIGVRVGVGICVSICICVGISIRIRVRIGICVSITYLISVIISDIIITYFRSIHHIEISKRTCPHSNTRYCCSHH